MLIIYLDVLAKGNKTNTIDRLIQHNLKLNRRKSASMIKIEVENERIISLHVDTIRKWAPKVGQVARKKLA